jgi:hypothetical protein
MYSDAEREFNEYCNNHNMAHHASTGQLEHAIADAFMSCPVEEWFPPKPELSHHYGEPNFTMDLQTLVERTYLHEACAYYDPDDPEDTARRNYVPPYIRGSWRSRQDEIVRAKFGRVCAADPPDACIHSLYAQLRTGEVFEIIDTSESIQNTFQQWLSDEDTARVNDCLNHCRQ